jgi:hypothetical protein
MADLTNYLSCQKQQNKIRFAANVKAEGGKIWEKPMLKK